MNPYSKTGSYKSKWFWVKSQPFRKDPLGALIYKSASVPAVQYKTMPFTRNGHIFQKCWDKNRLSFFSLLSILAMPWRSWWKAEHVVSLMFLSTLCGWSHGEPFDYSGIIFWLQFNMALLRERETERAMEFPFSALCECEWTDYMSKSRDFLCPTLKSKWVPCLFC